jgi:sterol desaturase/sphingolipid hydroxylase (fatty acid hydroxylase superfamily)
MDRLQAILETKAFLVLAVLGFGLVLERALPATRVLGGLRRVMRNLSLAGVNAVLSWLVVVPLTALAADQALGWRPTGWQGPLALLADLLVLDLWIYWWHRANHELSWLWRFHSVHHLDEFLDASSALRFHFGEVLIATTARLAVIVILDIPLLSVIAFETLLAIATIFHHSNLRLPPAFERALSWVIVTPSIHWVHHHARRADTDSNYATVLSLWDRVFASTSATARTPDMKIGVEGESDQTIGALLAEPFRRKP